MENEKISSFTAAGLILLLFSGCGWFSDYTTVRLDLDESYFPWDGYILESEHRIIYPDPDDPSSQTELILEPGKMSTDIRICKGNAVPVAVYSSAGGKPVGGIFPRDLKNGMSLEVSPEQGFIAELFLSMLSFQTRLEALNTERLIKTISGKCGGDPWSIDSKLLRTSILFDSMAEFRVKKMDSAIYQIEGITGVWIPGNLFKKSAASEEPEILSLNLYPGITGFLNPETGEKLFVSVENGIGEYIITK